MHREWSDGWFDELMPYRSPEKLPADIADAAVAFGTLMRSIRGGLGLTQRRLAERCGVSQTTISRFERGRAPTMRFELVLKILVALRVELAVRPCAW